MIFLSNVVASRDNFDSETLAYIAEHTILFFCNTMNVGEKTDYRGPVRNISVPRSIVHVQGH